MERRTETLVILERSIDHATRSDTEGILTLQCYAYWDGDAWEAICIDFDIATFAPSLDEAKASLVTCIELFLEGVAEAPPEDGRLLLRRRSPWHLEAKLATLTWMSRLCNDARQALQFTLQSSVPAYSWPEFPRNRDRLTHFYLRQAKLGDGGRHVDGKA